MEYFHQYFPTIPDRPIVIDELFTIHYFENYRDYFFPGEKHNFWELLYVDRGEIIVQTDHMPSPIHLEQGDLILHQPNEFHSFYANDISAHNLFVISFSSSSPAMERFKTQTVFHVHSVLRSQIGLILQEAKDCFSVSLSDPNTPFLEKNPNAAFGSEQVIVSQLELLLLSLYREEHIRAEEDHEEEMKLRLSHDYIQRSIAYMKENLTSPIKLEDICAHAAISRSQLQKMFQQQQNMSVMQYFSRLRIEEAKYLIRGRNMTFTEIAELLCYSSVHHFSKRFRETTGMSPTDYAASIQLLTSSGSQPEKRQRNREQYDF